MMPDWIQVCYMFYVWDKLIRWQKEGYLLPRNLLIVGDFLEDIFMVQINFLFQVSWQMGINRQWLNLWTSDGDSVYHSEADF
jgi:hypothetical protein